MVCSLTSIDIQSNPIAFNSLYALFARQTFFFESPTTPRLIGCVLGRLEKLFALGPADALTPDVETAFSRFDKEKAIEKLSPTTGRKRLAVFTNPTKQALADYDKIMTSADQSLRKAITQLDKTTDGLQAAKEEAAAHAERQGSTQNACQLQQSRKQCKR